MVKPELLTKTKEVHEKFNKFVYEIVGHLNNFERKQAEVKTKRLERFLIKHLFPREKQLRELGKLIAVDPEKFRFFIMSTMAFNLRETEFFNQLDAVVRESELNLLKKFDCLNQEVVSQVVRFGILLVSFKGVNKKQDFEDWNGVLQYYLENFYKFTFAQADEIICATMLQVSKLVKPYFLSTEYILYHLLIEAELSWDFHCYSDDDFIDFVGWCKDYENHFGPFINRVNAIYDNVLLEEEEYDPCSLRDYITDIGGLDEPDVDLGVERDDCEICRENFTYQKVAGEV